MPYFEDQRVEVEGQPRVDIPDEQRETLRRLQDFDVPLKLHWDLGYASGDETKLKELYEKGKSGQWNARTDVDWSIPIDEGDGIAPPMATALGSVMTFSSSIQADEETIRQATLDEVMHTLSQLLHGEQAALQLTAQLVNAIPDLDSKFYAASQVIDEARHVEVFSYFLNEKYGHIWPVDGPLKFLLDELLSADTWHKKAVGMQVLFEGMALGIFAGLEQSVTNTLFQDILRRVTVDEARHAAFGMHALRRHLPELTTREMEDLEDFAYDILECLFHGAGRDMMHNICPRYGLDPDRLHRSVLKSEAFKMSQAYIYNHTCLPNLEKLGLLTDRTRPGYVSMGLLPDA